MTREDILKQLQDIITLNFEIPADKLTPDAEFRAHLGMDSLDLVDLTFFIKRRFLLEEGAHAYRNLRTVGEVVDFIHARTATAEA